MADERLPFPVKDLLRAVRAEIEAVLADEAPAATRVLLRDGRIDGRDGDRRGYLFSCRNWNTDFTGKDLLVREKAAGRRWARAEATKLPGDAVSVRTEGDLGARPGAAELIEDETGGLETLAERLERAGDGSLNLTAAGWIIGRGRPATARCATPDRFVRGYPGRLNARQRAAVEQALASEATFVWGPPGTGKTDVVSRIVEGSHRQGLKVLFLAPTHVAVDQALERVCKLLEDEDGFDAGLVQRAGDIAVPSLAAAYGEWIVPERIAERLGADLDRRIAAETERLTTMRADLARHDEAEGLAITVRDLRERLDEHAGWSAVVRREADAAEHAAADVARRIAAEGVPSGLFARRKEERLAALRARLAEHRRAAEELRGELVRHMAARQPLAAEHAAAQRAYAALAERLRGVPGAARLRDAVTRANERLEGLRRDRQKIAEAVRGRCRVLGTTVAKAVQSRRLLDADVVVLDEAGMVDLPSAWFAAGLAAKRVVIAGDFRQLPAVTRGSSARTAPAADREHSRTWMDRDAFHAAGLVGADGRVRPDARLVALNEQYRMRRAICAVVNAVAYPDAPLATGRREASGLPPSLVESPLVLVDTSDRRIGDPGVRGAHRANAVHEAAIHELVRGLQYDAVLPARRHRDGPPPTDFLAVIVPYNDQKRHLGRSLTYRFGAEYDGLVDTVHRFQGSQRPLVVIDTVAGAGRQLGYFYEGTGLASHTSRLLNVALSRAQDHLVVVANTAFLRRNLPPGGEAALMLRHLEAHAQRIPVDDLVPVRSAADLGGLDEDELRRPAFFPADEVPRAVAWDIARARSGIDVYCAFLAAEAVRRWLPRLAARTAEGVRVTVHTRDPAPRDEPLVARLRAAGCEVRTRERMHEKVLILDDAVLWHGSLNLLAHTGSTDLMMRLTDPAACERVRRIVDRARMDRPARTPPPRTADGVRPGDVRDGRRYLDVPYAEKDDVKRLVGAKWEPSLKLWHVDAALAREKLTRWLPTEP
ncbi:exonuclease V subunit alpha [Actinomadura rubteroloni]|uniref:Exonuclease V subunit alpha n=1 Tax=Actinomadura rubteroloni TaxID=1926885 RepID=A0A2P4UGR2_9ACTN|nr:AAA domain-containing protein [Actinomadura rubteroloni]POM24247.1 exonuclease V subunit alpha [Actinomadura rubteroloni]